MPPTIRCSSIDRVLNCAHSLSLPAHNTTNNYSSEGTKQHKLIVDYFKTKSTEGMNSNTILYLNYILSKMEKFKVYVEKSHQKVFDNFILQGTPDAYWFEGNDLYVIDLKNGYMEVDPLNNQLKGYGLLVGNNDTDKVHIIIVQNDEVKKITFSHGLLHALIIHINKSLMLNKFESGMHCQFCPSKQHCVKMRDPLDFKDEYELLKNETYIKGMLKNVKDRMLIEKPEWFYEKSWGRGRRFVFKGE